MWKATLDACALYATTERDLLLHLAAKGLYEPVWSDKINSEWVGSRSRRRKKRRANLQVTVDAMNASFPHANVADISPVMKKIKLRARKDRHVLAAAVMSGSQIVVTWNMRDFPASSLNKYGIQAMTPDQFIARLAFKKAHVESYIKDVYKAKFPGKSTRQILEKLERCKLRETVKKMRELLT